MEPWTWALVLKWPLMVLLAPVYFFTVVVFVRWLRRRYRHPLIEQLTRERGERDPEVIARRAAARQRFEAEQQNRARLEPPEQR